MVKQADEALEVKVPFVPWRVFLPTFMVEWGPNDTDQDRHVSVVGHTGSGKTTMVYAILNERVRLYDSAVLSVVTKARDTGIARQTGNGWAIRRKMADTTKGHEAIGTYGQDRIIFWPPYGDPQTVRARQARVLRPMLQRAFKEGRRVIHFNEVFTLVEMGLKPTLQEFWREGRSNQEIVVAETQRPVDVPREMWTEARHLFAFKITDLRDIETVGKIGMGRVSAKVIAARMADLGEFECLYVNLRTGRMMRTKVNGR